MNKRDNKDSYFTDFMFFFIFTLLSMYVIYLKRQDILVISVFMMGYTFSMFLKSMVRTINETYLDEEEDNLTTARRIQDIQMDLKNGVITEEEYWKLMGYPDLALKSKLKEENK